jgi:hypothetical protein
MMFQLAIDAMQYGLAFTVAVTLYEMLRSPGLR